MIDSHLRDDHDQAADKQAEAEGPTVPRKVPVKRA
jgi:hypothetical protein